MRKKNNKDIFDVAVIGAGPAGLIAAGRAAELGARVVLIEKNSEAGKKLLLTGNGRCNLANAEFDLRKLVSHYGKNGSFLFQAFSVFGPKEAIAFFENRGLKIKTEDKNRVFPRGGDARDVLKILIDYAEGNGVLILCGSRVAGIEAGNSEIAGIVLGGEEKITAKNYIFCSGGKSYPATGSGGDGMDWAEGLGHSIVRPSPALVPVAVREDWVKDLQGTVLNNAGISVWQNGKKSFSSKGECLFTHFGLSGPAVINASRSIGEILERGGAKIFIDLFPETGFPATEKAIADVFQNGRKKSIVNCLDVLAPRRLAFALIKMAGLDPDGRAGNVSREQRMSLAKIFRKIEMTPERLLGFDQAMVTSGGVSLGEIDAKTMKSKIAGNLFFAGEIIDIDGETGGFNLQNCWSTGYLAGQSAAADLRR